MSFGLRDKDWVDPDPKPEKRCNEETCIYFTLCPSGCGWGVCECTGEFVRENDLCE